MSNSETVIKAAGPIDVRSERSLGQEPVVSLFKGQALYPFPIHFPQHFTAGPQQQAMYATRRPERYAQFEPASGGHGGSFRFGVLTMLLDARASIM